MATVNCACILGLMSILVVLSTPSSARSPIPYYKNVERLGLDCRGDLDASQRERICRHLARWLSDRADHPVMVGAPGGPHEDRLTLLVGLDRVTDPGDRDWLAVSLDLFRAGHVDPRLRGPKPVLLRLPEAPAPEDWLTTMTTEMDPAIRQILLAPLGLARPNKGD